MARLWSSGFELNSVTTGVEFNAITNAPSIQTGVVRSGTYAMRINSLSSGARKCVIHNHDPSGTTGPIYHRFYFYYTTLPTADNAIFQTNNSLVTIQLTSTGTLKLKDEDGAIGSASPAMSSATWYRIELAMDLTGAGSTDVITARLDGTDFATASNRNLSGTLINGQYGGNLDNEAQTQGDWYFDDLAVNDSTGSYQNSYPGEGKIIHLRPSAAGDNAQWTASAGSNYTTVDEVTPNDDTDYVRNSVTLNEADDYNVDNSGIGASDTVNLVAVGFRGRAETSVSNEYEFTLRAKKTASGTVSESASINLATTSHVTNSSPTPRNYRLTLYQDPDSAAWTQTTLDSMQIGVKTSVTSTNRIRVSTLWALVDYTPSAGGAGTGTGDVITVVM